MSTHNAKRPVTRLAGSYGHPVHPILVTVPIGAWVASLVFDVASRIVDEPGFLTHSAEWLIGLGVVGAAVAAAFGLLDLLAIPPGARAFRIGLTHMGLNLAVTVAFVVDFLWRHGSYTDQRPVGTGPLVLSIVALAALGVSGFLGGMLTYRYGVRVADESTQAEGFDAAAPHATGSEPRRSSPV
jgi:uncharacterized membrane protein